MQIFELLPKEILQNIPKEIQQKFIQKICVNSKEVTYGDLFVVQDSANAQQYLLEAIDRGACAAFAYKKYHAPEGFPLIVFPSREDLEYCLSKKYFKHPSSAITVIGVTGTSGKTTTTSILKFFLEQVHVETGLIGTIHYQIKDKILPATHTTPDFFTTHQLLQEMVESSCATAVMEVSSHALVQGRVNQIDYDIAVFTNLSHEHLDYHKSMEEYAYAKSLLFKQISDENNQKNPKWAVVNEDDPYKGLLLSQCSSSILTYGFSESADVRAENIQLLSTGTSFTLSYKGQQETIKTHLIGYFNISNLLAVAAVAICLHYELDIIAKILAKVSPVKGRLERVPNPHGIHVYVDYSHKPEALEKVLSSLSAIKKGKIITLFGCGGDRDRLKRPIMAAIAEKYSDTMIVTSDNPRSENPNQIISEIIQGFSNLQSVIIEPDRKNAIFRAIQIAKAEDIVLIAGKGHETVQILDQTIIHFDDFEVATLALNVLS